MTVLDIVACAVAAGLTSFVLLERREARHFVSAKAEELYSFVEAYEQGLVGYFAMKCSLVVDGAPYLPNSEAGLTKVMGDSARARMLISFYFPSLWPQLKRADAAVSASFVALRRYEASRQDDNALMGLEQTLLDMRETVETLKHAVVMAHRDHERRAPIRRKLATQAEALRMAA